MPKKYILTVRYKPYNQPVTTADLIVTNPQVSEDGIWATSETAWGGTGRHFYSARNIISFEEVKI